MTEHSATEHSLTGHLQSASSEPANSPVSQAPAHESQLTNSATTSPAATNLATSNPSATDLASSQPATPDSASLHPPSKNRSGHTPPRRSISQRLWRHLRIPFASRLFLLYFLLVGLTGYLVLNLLSEQIKPGFRQASEETLIDASQHLADVVSPYLRQGDLANQQLQQLLRNYGKRSLPSNLWGLPREKPDYRLYITDDRGIVLFDSTDQALGQDYSRWNDVYKTLRGEYGARSSKASADANAPSMMHIAAPIRNADGKIIGVLTLAKSNGSLQPFIDRSQRYVLERGLLLMALGLLVGALLTWRLQLGLNRLRQYIHSLNAGLRVPPPQFRLFFEFGELAEKLDTLRGTLEGKALRDQALQTLTHELKSPLTAIRAATEILASGTAERPLPSSQQQKFLGHISQQAERLTQLTERLLQVSSLEQLPHLAAPQPVPLRSLIDNLCRQNQARFDAKQLVLSVPDSDSDYAVLGDASLLQQALQHLVDNAMDFAPNGGYLRWWLQQQGQHIMLTLANQGPQIPDYALSRVTEKFYSLPRPQSQSGVPSKSTGLGLAFVEQVMQLHHGELRIANLADGVQVSLVFQR